MSLIHKLGTNMKVAFLAAAFAAGFIVFGAVAMATLNNVKVNGPHYTNIVLYKDLLADVLPPPKYIVETYLVAHSMGEAETPEALQTLVGKFQALKKEYAARQEYWRVNLDDSPLKQELIVVSRRPAEAFFTVVEQELIPTLEKGDHPTAEKILATKLAELFDEHRASINKIVEQSTANAKSIESEVTAIIASRQWSLLAVGFSVLAIVGGLTLWIGRVMARKEVEIARVHSMMESAPMNVMFADRDLRIQYVNPASMKTLKSIEHLLPVKVDPVLGGNIDIFHKNSSGQRQLLADPKNLPHREIIDLGTEKIDLLVCAIEDDRGNYLGPMVTWEIATQREKFNLVAQQISQSAVTLASSAEELTAVSSQMSVNAEETASQANVVSAAAEQVSVNVQTVSTGVEEMNSAIREIAKNATDSARVAQQAVTAAESANSSISKLDESSIEIGKVIKVITSIAEQTNLLALNATIEAARAGEAGKGFAVVANEVKELAKETAKATEDISHKIEAIQGDTRGAVQAIQEIGQVIAQINDISNTIASAVEEQTATANEMSRNVNEASKGTAEIAQNITSVAQAAQHTLQGANNVQQASGELAQMASSLQRVDGGSHASPAIAG